MADTSLIIGNGNWAVKEDSLLGYNIIQGKYVPIEMNVSRNTTGTRVKNSAGLIEISPKNLFSQSQTFDNAGWTPYPAGALTVIPNVLATSAPNGTFTADKLVANAVAGDHWLLQTPTGSSINMQVTFSVFAKAAEYSNIQLYNNNGGGGVANFNLSAGSYTLLSGVTADIIPYPNGWYRCYITYIPILTNFNAQIRLANSPGNTTFTGDGTSGVFVWGAQLEVSPTPTDYFPTTDKFDIPRVDYSTGTASLLVEPQRTNLIPNGLGYNPVAGVLYDLTITDSPAIGINSARITKNVAAGGGDIYAQQINSNAALLGSTTYTLSRYFKYDGHTITTSMQYNNNAPWGGTGWNQEIIIAPTGVTLGVYNPFSQCTSTIKNAGNGWYRVNVTILTGAAPVGSPQDLMILKSSLSTGQGFLTALPQLEVGSNATSYIPTFAPLTPSAGVTRVADVITKTGISSLIGQTEGTLYFEVQGFSDGNLANQFITLNDGTVANQIGFNYGTNGFINGYFRVNANTLTISSTVLKTVNSKIILKYNSSNLYTLFINGSLIGTGTAASSFSSPLTTFKTSQGDNSAPYNGNIKSIVLYKTALSNPQCINLTTTP